MSRLWLLATLCLAGTLLSAQVSHSCVAGACGSTPSYSPTAGELAADARERRQEREWERDHKHWLNAKAAVERARAAEKRGQYSTAVDILKLALNDAHGYDQLTTWIHHTLASVYNEWASTAHTQKDYLNSIRLFQQALGNWDLAGIRGNLAAEQNDYALFAYRNRQWQTAIDYVQQAMVTSPNTPMFQKNLQIFREGAAADQANLERQKQQAATESRNREAVRSAVHQLSSDVAVPLQAFPSAEVNFMPAGSSKEDSTYCGSGALQQLNCAAKTGDRAAHAQANESAESIAQTPFDRNSGLGPPPEKMKLNSMAVERFQNLQRRQAELQTQRQQLSSQLEAMRQ